MGRPSRYTTALAERICARLMEGESLLSICRGEGMPSCGTVFRWIAANERFRDNYSRAREIQQDVFNEQLVEIADTPVVHTTKTSKEWGVELKEGDSVEHRRLQIETRKWIMGRMKPKLYGARAPEPALPPTTPDAPPPEDYTLRPDESGPDAPIL